MNRVAKNAVMMQVRMLLAMAVGLVTSRITLQQLGFDDYGSYSLVWGILTLIVFANNTLTNASFRFLSYDNANEDKLVLHNTFAASKRAHLYAAIAIIFVAETIGLLYLIVWANIPVERVVAVNIAYQISLIIVAATVLQSPYCALLIAREKMNVYATIEIINVSLKLGLVYLLLLNGVDKLILLSGLYAALSVVVYFIYRIYCKKHFEEVCNSGNTDNNKCKEILRFSATDLYGNAAVSLRDNGFVLILNSFFGVVLNAACNIATVVNRAFSGLASNVLYAYKPQITMSYARSDYGEMSRLVGKSSFYSIITMGLTMSLAIAFMPSLLRIWLGNVPDNAVVFTQLLLVTGLIETVYNPLVSAIHASGKIKALSFLNGSLYLINLPIIIVLYLFGHPAYVAYICLIAVDIVIWVSTIFITKSVVPNLSISKYLLYSISAIVISILPAILLLFIIK